MIPKGTIIQSNTGEKAKVLNSTNNKLLVKIDNKIFVITKKQYDKYWNIKGE